MVINESNNTVLFWGSSWNTKVAGFAGRARNAVPNKFELLDRRTNSDGTTADFRRASEVERLMDRPEAIARSERMRIVARTITEKRGERIKGRACSEPIFGQGLMLLGMGVSMADDTTKDIRNTRRFSVHTQSLKATNVYICISWRHSLVVSGSVYRR